LLGATALLFGAIPPQAFAAQNEPEQIAINSYIFGYWLITTEVTRVQMSNIAERGKLGAPAGEFVNVPRIRPATIAASPRRTLTPSIRWPGSMSAPSRQSSPIRTRYARSAAAKPQTRNDRTDTHPGATSSPAAPGCWCWAVAYLAHLFVIAPRKSRLSPPPRFIPRADPAIHRA